MTHYRSRNPRRRWRQGYAVGLVTGVAAYSALLAGALLYGLFALRDAMPAREEAPAPETEEPAPPAHTVPI